MEALVKLMRDYFDFRNLEAFLKGLHANANLKAALVMVVLAQLVSFFTVTLSSIVAAFFDPEVAALLSLHSIFFYVIFAIIGVGLFFVFSGFFHVLSKILGGKGDYAGLSYVLAVTSLAANLAAAPFLILIQVNEITEIVGSAIHLLLSAYLIFVQFRVLKAVHDISAFRAAAVVIIFWTMLFVFLAMLTLMSLPLQPVA